MQKTENRQIASWRTSCPAVFLSSPRALDHRM
jgi:hypothetical protein